jgi:hypothetical protein
MYRLSQLAISNCLTGEGVAKTVKKQVENASKASGLKKSAKVKHYVSNFRFVCMLTGS